MRFPGGEDYDELWARMRGALEQILDGKDVRNIVVVGHGGIFAATLKMLCPSADLHELLGRENHNCSVTEIAAALNNGALQAELVEWAACDHLSGHAADLVTGVPDEHAAERRRMP